MTNSTVAAASARAEQSSSVTAGVIEPFQLGHILVGVDGRPTGRDAIALGDALHEAIVAMLLEHTHPDHIAGLLGISARSLELRRQGILKRLGPTCGVDDGRQDGSEHHDPVATAGSPETRQSDETGTPEHKILLRSDHRMPPLNGGLAEGTQPPDLPDGEHPDSSPPAESRKQPQTSPASGLRSRAGLGSLAALGLGKRLTMSQPSRHTRYELTWSEIAILGLLGVGLLCVVALCVAVALQ